jgi:GNAT superfamily N-acetyltransferase
MSLGAFDPTEDGEDDGSVLAMIHGTRTSSTYASEASMAIGSHEPKGPTAALHSLCVHPGWRAKGIGTKILNEYIETLKKQNGIERISLIAHDDLVPFYTRYAFECFPNATEQDSLITE